MSDWNQELPDDRDISWQDSALGVLGVMLMFFAVAWVAGCTDDGSKTALIRAGYNEADVEAFYKHTDYNYTEMANSPAVRLEFDNWVHGNTAIGVAALAASRARSAQATASMAAGMAAVNAANAGSR